MKAERLPVQGLMENIPASEIVKVVQKLPSAIIGESAVGNDFGNIATQRFLRQWEMWGGGKGKNLPSTL